MYQLFLYISEAFLQNWDEIINQSEGRKIFAARKVKDRHTQRQNGGNNKQQTAMERFPIAV